MKTFFRDLSLTNKIALFTSLMMGASLLLLTVSIGLLNRSAALRDLENQAELLSSTLPYVLLDDLYLLRIDELRDLVHKVSTQDPITAFVVYDRYGVILADSANDKSALIPLSQKIDPFGLNLVMRQDESTQLDYQQKARQLVAARAVQLNGETIGAISITMSTERLEANLSLLIFESIAITFVVIIIGVLISIPLSWQLSRPLHALMDVTRKMADGNLNIRVESPTGDEIGKLGNAFNEMASKIQSRERALTEMTTSLEQKIAARTEELRLRNKELEFMATSDPLTKINNRRRFFELAEQEYERAKRYHHPLSLILIDADNFKDVNDNFGHQIGDELLINLANFFKNNIRSVDTAARYGGEEFIILMPEIGCIPATQIAERLRLHIAENPMVDDKHKVFITASFGVACWERSRNLSLDSLLYRADKALYQAKHDGRNRVAIWNDDIGTKPLG